MSGVIFLLTRAVKTLISLWFSVGGQKKSLASRGFIFRWWAVGDLNPGLPPCEDGTLTAELTAHK